VAIPTLIAVGVWLAYAADIGLARLLETMGRWFGSAAGSTIRDRRLHVGPRAWVNEVIQGILGPILLFASGVTAGIFVLRREPAPRIVLVSLAYVAVAVAASFIIRLKEPRFLIAIVPMLAVSIALVVDWDDIWAEIRGRDATGHPGATPSRSLDLTAEADSR
jgi:hypothetical protein